MLKKPSLHWIWDGCRLGVILALLALLGWTFQLNSGWDKSDPRQKLPTIQGTVLINSIDIHKQPVSKQGLVSTQYWIPNVTYSYQVDGQDYTRQTMNDDSWQKRFKQEFTKLDEANLYLVKFYRRGQRVNIYYNPENPAEGYLEIVSTQAVKKAGL